MIVKAAGHRDVRDLLPGLAQKSRGRGQPRLRDELDGRESEEPLDQPRETHRRQPGPLRQRTRRDRLGVMRFEIFQHRRDRRRQTPRIARLAQIARDAHEPDDFAAPIPQEIVLLDACEVLPCTSTAEQGIRAVKNA